MRIRRDTLLMIIALAGITGCAIQVPPSGGDKDVHPPKVLSVSPENYTTEFSGHNITFTFDEFVQLKDVNTQLVVSPPLKYKPEVRLQKHSMLISLDDTLMENTTYTMNFGSIVRDLNEGNVLEDLQYVFSTGPVIDTLSINGKVEEAFNLKTPGGVLVMLYPTGNDSLPLKELPRYFAKTKDNGGFRIQNIAEGNYSIFALKEENADYLYDDPTEMIAFSLMPVHPSPNPVLLRLFAQRPQLGVLRFYSEEPGKAVVVFNTGADSIPFLVPDDDSLEIFKTVFSEQGDSLILWYKNIRADSMQVIFKGKSLRDTLFTRLFTYDPGKPSRRKFFLQVMPVSVPGGLQDLYNPFVIQFNHPVLVQDTGKIILTLDSVVQPPVSFTRKDSTGMIWELRAPWKEENSCSLYFPAGVFHDIFGLSNDSIVIPFKVRKERDYGSIALAVLDTSKGTDKILQLVNDGGEVIRELPFTGDTTLTIAHLLPGTFRLKLIFDENLNGKWDTGNYFEGIEPETVKYYPDAVQVRANWDIELNWKP